MEMDMSVTMRALFEAILKEREWVYDSAENVITTGVGITEELTAMVHIITNEDAYSVMCALDVDVPEPRQETVAAFNDLVNMGAMLGGFYLDRQEHLLVFRISSICLGQLPTQKQAMAALDYAVEMIASAAEPLLAMLSGVTAEEAYPLFVGTEED